MIKLIKRQKRASVYCVNIKWSYTNSPARNSNWWAERNEEPLSLLQVTRVHQASSKHNTVLWSNRKWLGPNALHFKRTSTIRIGIRTNNKALTFPMRSVAKKHIISEKMNWYSCMIHNVRQKHLPVFSLHKYLRFQPHPKKQANPNYFDEFVKHFSLHFPQPLLVAEDSPKFFTWYVERCLFQGSRHNTDTPTALMLTKCVNALTGNPPDFH